MKKLLKLLAWLVAIVVILVVAAILILIFAVNPNQYKGKISDAVYQATGRTLTINGEIHWSFYPSLGVTVSDVSLSNPSGYPAQAFLHVDQAKVNIQLLPLLSKQLEVNTIAISGIQVYLIQKDAQHNNWTFTSQTVQTSTAQTAQTGTGAPPSSSAAHASLPLHIKNIEVDHADIDYKNLQTGAHYQVNTLAVTGQHISFDQPFPITVSLAVHSAAPEVTAHMDLSAELSLNMTQQFYALQELQLEIVGQMVTASGRVIPLHIEVAGNVAANLASEKIELNPTFTFDGATLNTHIIASQFLHTLKYQGQLQLKPFNLTDVLHNLGQPAPEFPNPDALRNISLSTQVSGGLDSIDLEAIQATLNQTKISGSINVNSFAMPQFGFHLAVDQINVADYVNLYGALLSLNDLQLVGQVSSHSWQQPQLNQQLNGSVHVVIGKSVLKGLDVAAMLRQVNATANAIVQGGDIFGNIKQLEQQLPQVSEKTPINPNNGQQTQFGYFYTTAEIHNGFVNNQTISLKGDNFAVEGNGTIDLVHNNTVNYHLSAYSTEPKATPQTADINLPVYIQGTLEHLQYGVDLPNLLAQLKNLVTKNLQTQLTNTVQSVSSGAPVEGGVQQKAQQLLQGIFGK